MTDGPTAHLNDARDEALAVRALYEILERRFNGQTWTLHEIMIGFSNDVGYVGRLLLANEGTWPVDGDPRAELEHKLSESMWWLFVIADRLGIDLDEAFATTMDHIGTGLRSTIARTAGDTPES